MKKNTYVEPAIRVNRLSEEDILTGPSESSIDSDELFDSEDNVEDLIALFLSLLFQKRLCSIAAQPLVHYCSFCSGIKALSRLNSFGV